MDAKAIIKNCGLSLAVECQQQWSLMLPTDSNTTDEFEGTVDVKRCPDCRKNVHLVTNHEALKLGAELGRCMFFVPILEKYNENNSREKREKLDIDKIDISGKTLGLLKP